MILDKVAEAVTAKVAGYAILAGLLLLILLALSVTMNVRQWADHRAYVNGEHDRLTAAAAKASAETSARIATAAGRDNTALLGELREIADRAQRTRTVYRQAAARAPLAVNCAPGQARLDAVNAGADK